MAEAVSSSGTMRKQLPSVLQILCLLLLIAILITSCTSQPSDCSREDVFCIGMVTAYEGVDNHGLNQASWEALQNIESQTQTARLDYIESIDTRDWQKNIVFFGDNGYDVIVTVGVNLSEPMIEAAIEYPHILFIGVDQQPEEVYENIATIHFVEEQAGFLAGVLAAMVTESGKVGAVCETSGIDAVWRYCEGFRAGALHADDEVDIYIEYREDGSRDKIFNDPEWGEQQALHLIDDGVDILSGYGGNTTQGAFLAASEEKTLIIGGEEDLYFRLPDSQPVLVTSIIKDPSVELSYLVLMASQGEVPFGQHTGQIIYKPLQNLPKQTPGEVEMKLKDTYDALLEGIIEINLPEKD